MIDVAYILIIAFINKVIVLLAQYSGRFFKTNLELKEKHFQINLRIRSPLPRSANTGRPFVCSDGTSFRTKFSLGSLLHAASYTRSAAHALGWDAFPYNLGSAAQLPSAAYNVFQINFFANEPPTRFSAAYSTV